MRKYVFNMWPRNNPALLSRYGLISLSLHQRRANVATHALQHAFRLTFNSSCWVTVASQERMNNNNERSVARPPYLHLQHENTNAHKHGWRSYTIMVSTWGRWWICPVFSSGMDVWRALRSCPSGVPKEESLHLWILLTLKVLKRRTMPSTKWGTETCALITMNRARFRVRPEDWMTVCPWALGAGM